MLLTGTNRLVIFLMMGLLRIQYVCLCLTCSCLDSVVKLFLGFNFLLFIVFERYWTQAFANNVVLGFFPGFSIRQFG